MTQRPAKEWVLFNMEVRRFFSDRHNLKFIPLICLAVVLIVWPYIGSPFVPVVLAVFAGLESQYNNMLFRSPAEYETLSLFPVSWRHVILAKNLSTLTITVILFAIVSYLY